MFISIIFIKMKTINMYMYVYREYINISYINIYIITVVCRLHSNYRHLIFIVNLWKL